MGIIDIIFAIIIAFRIMGLTDISWWWISGTLIVYALICFIFVIIKELF